MTRKEKADAFDAIIAKRRNIGLAKSPRKGFGSLTKQQRSELSREAAKKRWHTDKIPLD